MTGAVLIDLRKAFDTVDHVRLLSKLPNLGIENKELCWFESYLFGRTQIASYDGALSEVKLFTVEYCRDPYWAHYFLPKLINDIDENLSQFEMTLYADDSVLYIAGKKVMLSKEG